jgi:hypothetical protein
VSFSKEASWMNLQKGEIFIINFEKISVKQCIKCFFDSRVARIKKREGLDSSVGIHLCFCEINKIKISALILDCFSVKLVISTGAQSHIGEEKMIDS